MRGRVGSTLRRLAPLSACRRALPRCRQLRQQWRGRCAVRGLAERALDRARRAGPQRRRRLSGRLALCGWRPRLCSAGRPELQRRGSRLMVWRGFPRPRHRKRRNLRRRRHLRRAPDPATAQLCAGDESEQRPVAHRARQRPRALSGNRIIDVSKRAAHLLGFTNRGLAWVRVQYVGRAPIEGSDDRMLESTLRENAPAPAPGTCGLPRRRSCRPSPCSRRRCAMNGLPAPRTSATTSDASPYARSGRRRCRSPTRRRRQRHRPIPQWPRALLI